MKCPSCGSTDISRIVYGMPGPELLERARREPINLRGCCIPFDPPQWRCRSCEHEWGPISQLR